MLFITGTLHENAKLVQMTNKWEQKKKTGKVVKTQEERMLDRLREEAKTTRENTKVQSIYTKIKNGETLTNEELQYLQEKNPQLIQEYKKIRLERKAYENQLKHCESKEEVEQVKINKINGCLSAAKSTSNNPNIPKGAKVAILEGIMARVCNIQDVHMKFVSSSAYTSLPDDATEKAEVMNTEEVKQPVTEVKETEVITQEEETVEFVSNEENVDSDIDVEVEKADVAAFTAAIVELDGILKETDMEQERIDIKI